MPDYINELRFMNIGHKTCVSGCYVPLASSINEPGRRAGDLNDATKRRRGDRQVGRLEPSANAGKLCQSRIVATPSDEVGGNVLKNKLGWLVLEMIMLVPAAGTKVHATTTANSFTSRHLIFVAAVAFYSTPFSRLATGLAVIKSKGPRAEYRAFSIQRDVGGHKRA